MRKGLSSKLILTILIGLLAIQTPVLLAQWKERKERRTRQAAVVVNPPGERTRVVVGTKEYHYAHGVFYRPGPKGYIAIRGEPMNRLRSLACPFAC
jgi:hypothetical protein